MTRWQTVQQELFVSCEAQIVMQLFQLLQYVSLGLVHAGAPDFPPGNATSTRNLNDARTTD